ncbi:MAG: sugar isomerase domain-containing protein [Athalassotoga sp.]|uniref:sugar isomerase domain-containing protein n=1 Tax=Athalassotoga sp. TaxID=2022597 RepID=UPI003D076FAB
MKYLDTVIGSLKYVDTQKEKFEEAISIIENSLRSNGLIYIFGTGHSHMLAEEIFYRAGGLAAVYPVLIDELMLHRKASISSELERVEGYIGEVLDGYDLSSFDVFIVISNSGINAVPVEAALYAKSKGCKVIAITSLNHSKNSKPRNSKNLHLYEIADTFLDNGAPKGDATIDVGGKKMGPISTITGAFILNSLIIGTAEKLEKEGVELPIFLSANVENGDEINAKILVNYKKRVPIL